jgi:predicted dehydrogenase
MTILIVGGGKMGMSHLALVTQYVGKSNVALCDSKLSTRLLFRFLGYQTFASVDASAERLSRLDGVLIATPTASHASLARWAIERKVPFFVEKPLTLDFACSCELVRMAEAAGVPTQAGFVLRYVATFQRLRRLVADGRLGRLKGYFASMRGNFVTKPPAPGSWQGDFARGGGCLNEYGPHIIDLCRFIFGPIQSIGAAEIGQTYSTRADDRVTVEWIHDDDTPGTIEIDWCDPTKRKSVIEIYAKFELADVRVDNSAVEINRRDDAPLTSEEWARIDAPVQPPNVGFYLRGEEFSLEVEDFLGACLGRDLHVDPAAPTDTTPRLGDGCEVDRIIDKIARKVGLK